LSGSGDSATSDSESESDVDVETIKPTPELKPPMSVSMEEINKMLMEARKAAEVLTSMCCNCVGVPNTDRKGEAN